MAVDDRLAILEPSGQPGLPPRPRPRVVNHPDAQPVYLDHVLFRKRLLQSGLVHVPVHPFHPRSEGSQLLEKRHRHEVAGMEHEIRAAHQIDTGLGQRPRPAWQMRVRDDGDAAQRAAATRPGACKNRPACQTSSPSAYTSPSERRSQIMSQCKPESFSPPTFLKLAPSARWIVPPIFSSKRMSRVKRSIS